jgi:hypothetical protein
VFQIKITILCNIYFFTQNIQDLHKYEAVPTKAYKTVNSNVLNSSYYTCLTVLNVLEANLFNFYIKNTILRNI